MGKTTGVANVGAALAQLGKRTLLIDADPQGNLGELFGVDDPTLPGTRLEDALDADVWDAPPTPWATRPDPETGAPVPLAGGVHLLPCTDELASTVAELVSVEGAERRLRDLVALYVDRYDFILIDTPPGLGPLSSMAMIAGHWVIVPARPADFDASSALDPRCLRPRRAGGHQDRH